MPQQRYDLTLAKAEHSLVQRSPRCNSNMCDCDVAGGLACVPWRISPRGLSSGVLSHVQVYAREIKSEVAWYESGLFYRQLFNCKIVQCKTQVNFSVLMQSNTNINAKMLAVFCLFGASVKLVLV